MKKQIYPLSRLIFGKEHTVGRAINLARFSLVMNMLLGAGKIIAGFITKSFMMIAGGCYNLSIAAAKRLAVVGNGGDDELASYNRVGLFISVASGAYAIYFAILFTGGRELHRYSEIGAIAIAAVTFTEIALAVYGIIMSRKYKRLIIESIKKTNLVSALFSLILTQGALLTMSNVEKAAVWCGITGIIVGFLGMGIGLQMTTRRKVA